MLPSVINALRLVDEPAPDVPAQVPEVAHPAQVGGTGGTPSPAQVAQPDGTASPVVALWNKGLSLRLDRARVERRWSPYAIRHRVLGSPDGRSRPGSIRHRSQKLEKPRKLNDLEGAGFRLTRRVMLMRLVE